MSSAWGSTVASRSFPTFSGGEKHSGVSKPTFFTLEGGEELPPNDGRISLLPGFSCYSWIGGRRRAVRDGQGERGRLRIAMRASCRVDRCPSCESAGLNLRLPLLGWSLFRPIRDSDTSRDAGAQYFDPLPRDLYPVRFEIFPARGSFLHC